MTQRIAIGEARRRLAPLMDDVEARHKHVVITRNGRDSTVLMSAAEHESLMETLDVLADPGAMADLAESEADVRAGRVYEWSEVKKDLARRRTATARG